MTSGILLDTHVVLWLLADDPRMSHRALRTLRTERARLWVSTVSAFEIVIKHQAGKLYFENGLDRTLDLIFDPRHWSILPVGEQHVRALGKLPILHRDPFDRLLIAQAQIEEMMILTSDREMGKYPVATIW